MKSDIARTDPIIVRGLFRVNDSMACYPMAWLACTPGDSKSDKRTGERRSFKKTSSEKIRR